MFVRAERSTLPELPEPAPPLMAGIEILGEILWLQPSEAPGDSRRPILMANIVKKMPF